jgi:hypothetical protein
MTLAGVLSVAPRRAAAQEREPSAPLAADARLDVLTARTTAIHAGLGLGVPVGNYVRLSGLVAGGPEFGAGDGAAGSTIRGSGRADILARFTLDPFLESRWGGYAGAGASARYAAGTRVRGYLLAAIGVEGAPVGGWLPALELGIGGGTRVGVVLRRGRPGRR